MYNSIKYGYSICFFIILLSGCKIQEPGWYHTDTQAREHSQLTAEEFAKFAESDLIDVCPVVIPRGENLVGKNDYYMWPISTMIDDTMVVLYSRGACHWGSQKSEGDKYGGIRMIVTSSDGGKTWSKPFDLMSCGSWKKTPFCGFGGGIGSYKGVVYVALNKGIYKSNDKGSTWELLTKLPTWGNITETLWSAGTRLIFDDTHGMILWTTSGFSRDYIQRRDHGAYGTKMVALYSPDFGQTWKIESQPLPEGLRLSEVTPLQFNNKLAFFLRNGLKKTCYGQGYSDTGWFPFSFDISNIGPVGLVDTPDIQYNPRTKRIEVAGPHRKGSGPGPQGGMKANLYSMTPEEMASGKTEWRYDGTLIRYKHLMGKSDGFNTVGSVIDEDRNRRFFHVWAGDGTNTAAIFQYSISLDTEKVSNYLKEFYEVDDTDSSVRKY